MHVFREFDKIAIFNTPHLDFVADTNDANETAIITKNTVTIVKANRQLRQQTHNFLFETQVIEIKKFSATALICKFIDLDLNKLIFELKHDEFFALVNAYDAIRDLNLLSAELDEYPIETKWFGRHRLVLLTNLGNVQLLERTRTRNWFLVRNLADFVFESRDCCTATGESKRQSIIEKYTIFQTIIRQYLFTTICCFENLIFVANHENTIAVIEWLPDSSLRRLKTLDPDENNRIATMECIVAGQNEIYLMIGYTNGKLLANKITRNNGNQFDFVTKSIVAVAEADLIKIKKIARLTETGRFLVVRQIDLQIWQITNNTVALLEEFAYDSISGLIELEPNRVLLCTKNREFRLLDAIRLRLTECEFKSEIGSRISPNGMFNVSARGSIIAVTMSHPNPCVSMHSFFDANSSIRLFSGADTDTVLFSRPFDLIRKAIVSDRLTDFDTISELLEFTRVSIWKEPGLRNDYFDRVKKTDSFTDLELSLLYRCHEWQHSIERKPQMRLEIVNSLLARRAFHLLQKTILKPDVRLLRSIKSICYDYLEFYRTQASYNRKYQSDMFLIELDNLLRTIRESETDPESCENRPVCFECGSQLVHGLYCERLHVGSFCCLSLLPILGSSLTVRCPCCNRLVNDDFYEMFVTGTMPGDDGDTTVRLFTDCCFCKMTVQFY